MKKTISFQHVPSFQKAFRRLKKNTKLLTNILFTSAFKPKTPRATENINCLIISASVITARFVMPGAISDIAGMSAFLK